MTTTTITGTEAEDTFQGGAAEEYFDGLGGVDTIYYYGGDKFYLDGTAGVGGVAEGDIINNIENIFVDSYGGVEVYGNDDDNYIEVLYDFNNVQGGAGNDEITSKLSQHTSSLSGNEGNDTIYGGYQTFHYGGDGDDVIYDSVWADGGSGDDDITLRFNYATQPIVPTATAYGGAGYDSLTINAAILDFITQTAYDSVGQYATEAYFYGFEVVNGITLGYGTAGDDTIISTTDYLDGKEGNDQLFGDFLYGNSGNDLLQGNSGDNSLVGGSGDDTIQGGAGDDTLEGGDGDDELAGGDGANSINGGDGFDTITYEASSYGIDFYLEGYQYDWDPASAGADSISNFEKLVGSNFADTFYGNFEWAPDFFFALDGNDTIESWEGDDSIYGGFGDDKISSLAGLNQLYGDEGNDDIDGGNDADLLFGGKGNDTINGGLGNDTIDGGNGVDEVYGDEGDDRIFTGHGIGSVAYGGDDVDWVRGGDGDDELHGGSGQRVENGQLVTDTLYGGVGNDTIYGEEDNDFAVGGDGNDYLDGGVGRDDLQGSNGNDTLFGGSGNDILNGHAGNDVFLYTSLSDSARTATNLDNIFGFKHGEDKIDVTALGITGLGDGDNMLTVTVEGSKTYVEHTDSDFAFRLNGAMALGQSDFIGFTGIGNAGIDVPSVTVIYSHPETLVGSNDADWVFDPTGSYFEIRGNAGDDTLEGGVGTDSLRGSDDNDVVIGNEGNDTLEGDAGDDTLEGGVGYDNLNAGAGDDELNGGLNRDSLRGGDGEDIFVFDSAADSNSSNLDIIYDFVQGDDLIDVSALGYTAIRSGETVGTELGYYQSGDVFLNDSTNGFKVRLDVSSPTTLVDSDFIFA